VMGTFCAQNSGGNGEVGVRITENCNGSGAISVAQAYGNNSWTDANICTTIFFVSNMTARIAGDSCEYALEAAEIVDSTWTYPQDGTNSFSARWIPAR
jgi:hypothetical protein